MGTGQAELATTTAGRAGALGTVVSVVDGHVRGLDSVDPVAAAGTPPVRGWAVTGGTDAEVVRVATEARRVVPDGTELVDDAESYAQLLGLAEALRAAGFVVDEVLDGWRTVAVDVAVAVTTTPELPTRGTKPAKAKKTKKAKAPKPPKAKKARTTKATDLADPDGASGELSETASAPKKTRGGLLRRRSAPPSADSAQLEQAAA